ncbi:DUF6343 family protein [Streptomyces formicae]|uniref:Uncharacterized protein n=1 Tax=Streptomyces formicae TaxID=1616117 RepID=A0A291Q6A1_9ACTN|nr:DUF6343 family protein [Streptomyces formicae]ATL26964.1 hypothetical protein KY5_1946 [Streptomyces formicae]
MSRILKRTGSEPVTARSPLRMRLWFSVWGLIWAAFGTTVFALTGRTGWAVACGVLCLVVVTDLAVVVRRLRQGPHYQPGRDIPPYEPPRTPPGTS